MIDREPRWPRLRVRSGDCWCACHRGRSWWHLGRFQSGPLDAIRGCGNVWLALLESIRKRGRAGFSSVPVAASRLSREFPRPAIESILASGTCRGRSLSSCSTSKPTPVDPYSARPITMPHMCPRCAAEPTVWICERVLRGPSGRRDSPPAKCRGYPGVSNPAHRELDQTASEPQIPSSRCARVTVSKPRAIFSFLTMVVSPPCGPSRAPRSFLVRPMVNRGPLPPFCAQRNRRLLRHRGSVRQLPYDMLGLLTLDF